MVSNGQTEAGAQTHPGTFQTHLVIKQESPYLHQALTETLSHNLEVSLKIITISSLNRSQELPRFLRVHGEVVTETTKGTQQTIIIILSN